MKKFLLTISSIILSMLILLLIVSAADVQKSEFDIDGFLALAESQEDAIAAHNRLYDSFLEGGGPEAVFPENYGGDYIDGTILHICVVDLPQQDISPYLKLLDGYLDHVVFDDVAFSLQTLLDGVDSIVTSLSEGGVPIVFSEVDEEINAVVIGVEESEFSRSLVRAENVDSLYSVKQRMFDLPVYFEISEPYHLTRTLIGGTALDGYTLLNSKGLS